MLQCRGLIVEWFRKVLKVFAGRRRNKTQTVLEQEEHRWVRDMLRPRPIDGVVY